MFLHPTNFLELLSHRGIVFVVVVDAIVVAVVAIIIWL